jgi:hypothetical protein
MFAATTSDLAPVGHRRWGVALRSVGLVACLLAACTRNSPDEPTRPRPVNGTLLISGFGADGGLDVPADAAKHTSIFAPGADYAGMQDNDIRGFPNGRFVHGWNQVGQRHVRLGRQLSTSRFGEKEILRVLQRWDDIFLPPGARVAHVSLELDVEAGISRAADVMLYEVHRDWNPGSGGVKRDNTSPPAPGEVWWLEAAHGEKDWALPGASFASKDPKLGDVAPLPLATARYVPDSSKLVFSSTSLTAYLQRRVSAGKPLLFLLKLSDSDEDSLGEVVSFYSAEEGDSFGTDRRPKLSIEWRAATELVHSEQEVLLENGRSLELPKLATKGAHQWALSFSGRSDYESPTIEIRGGTAEVSSEWRSVAVPFEVDWDWIQARLVAARNPVSLGKAFESELKDTWVRTAKAKDQRVIWTFTSPLGKEIQHQGSYQEDYRWRITFDPQIPGRWSYYVSHNLDWQPYRSAQVFFDVISDDLAEVMDHLEELAERIESSDLETPSERFDSFGDEFLRLERAAIQLLTPEAFRSEEGARLSSRIDEIRNQLGQAFPEQPEAMGRRF